MTTPIEKNLSILDELARIHELLRTPWDEAMESGPARLQTRAAVLAREQDTPPETEASVDLLLFRLGDALHGLDLAGIERVLSWRPCVSIPEMPVQLAGIADINGEIVSIMDLHRLLGLSGKVMDASGRLILIGKPGQRFGLMVSGLEGIRTLSRQEIQPPPVATPPVLGRYLLGVTLDGVFVLDAVKLINAPELTINQDS